MARYQPGLCVILCVLHSVHLHGTRCGSGVLLGLFIPPTYTSETDAVACYIPIEVGLR